MAFPTSPSNNQVHKEGNRAFVYDSALGTWDQVRETDRTENKILSGELSGAVTGGAGLRGEGSKLKELKRFYYSTKTADTSAIVTDLNISGGNSCGPFTPEHNDDIFIMNWTFNVWINLGYMGWGVSMDDNVEFSSPSHIHRKGRHAHGSSNSNNGDHMHYQNVDGNFHCSASQISATVGTAWYFRMIGMTHTSNTNGAWGEESTSHVNSQGIAMVVQRWSEV